MGKMYLIYSLPSLNNFIWKIFSCLLLLKMFAEQSVLALKILLFPLQDIRIYYHVKMLKVKGFFITTSLYLC